MTTISSSGGRIRPIACHRPELCALRLRSVDHPSMEIGVRRMREAELRRANRLAERAEILARRERERLRPSLPVGYIPDE